MSSLLRVFSLRNILLMKFKLNVKELQAINLDSSQVPLPLFEKNICSEREKKRVNQTGHVKDFR